MNKQVTLSLKDSLKKLQKDLESLAPSLESEINQAVKDAAYAAYASIVAKAQKALNSTRQDYLKGLSFEDLGDNSFLISLDGDLANHLEDGYPAFNLVPKMLESKKTVQVGSRSGQPWVQNTKPKGKNKESHRFAHVPLQLHPHSKAAGTSNLADAVKQLTATNLAGFDQKFTQIFKYPDGSVQEGKVAVVRPPGSAINASTPYAMAHSPDARLQGLVKYQKIYKNSAGKDTVQSIYINYRTISDKGKPWIHPGFSGVHFFDEAEKELVNQLNQIIKSLL